MTETRPEKGTPEYERWRKERSKRRAEELLSENEEVKEQVGVLSGGKDDLREKNSDRNPTLKPVK